MDLFSSLLKICESYNRVMETAYFCVIFVKENFFEGISQVRDHHLELPDCDDELLDNFKKYDDMAKIKKTLKKVLSGFKTN